MLTRKYIQQKLDEGVYPGINLLRDKLARGIDPRTIPAIGGAPDITNAIAFQEARASWLEWAKTANDEDVFKRIKTLEDRLGQAKYYKYRDVSALTTEQIQDICFLEDMEIAIGIHPFCK